MAKRPIKREVPLQALFGTTISAHDKEITIHCVDHDVRDEILNYLLGHDHARPHSATQVAEAA